MYFLDMNILVKQLLPPHWRQRGKMAYLNTILTPCKWLLKQFHDFRKEARSQINLSAQTLAVERHIESLAGVKFGISLSDGSRAGHFIINLPITTRAQEARIQEFLRKITPAGRTYTLNFYSHV